MPETPDISRSVLRRVAASVDAPPSLLPILGELFEGTPSLGSVPRKVVSIMRGAGIGPESRVLDLACGKGAAAIALARSLRCRVVGVDAYAPFIVAAEEAAKKAGVSRLCAFRVGDVDAFKSGRGPGFDGAMMLGLYAAPRAAKLLRAQIRRGGIYLIDDAFRAERGRLAPGLGGFYDEVPTREELIGQLLRSSDTLLREVVPARREIAKHNAALYARLSRRAKALAKRHPHLAAELGEFLSRQREANRVLLGPLRPAMWLLRRT